MASTKKENLTPRTLLTRIYHAQKWRSKVKGWPPPTYTLQELQERFLYDEFYLRMFQRWADFGYQKDMIPSVDRIDSGKPYTMDNIQMLTWKENMRKGHAEGTTAVIMFNLYGEKLREFDSIKQASEETGIHVSKISKCCSGEKSKYKDYVFEYRDKNRRRRARMKKDLPLWRKLMFDRPDDL